MPSWLIMKGELARTSSPQISGDVAAADGEFVLFLQLVVLSALHAGGIRLVPGGFTPFDL